MPHINHTPRRTPNMRAPQPRAIPLLDNSHRMTITVRPALRRAPRILRPTRGVRVTRPLVRGEESGVVAGRVDADSGVVVVGGRGRELEVEGWGGGVAGGDG